MKMVVKADVMNLLVILFAVLSLPSMALGGSNRHPTERKKRDITEKAFDAQEKGSNGHPTERRKRAIDPKDLNALDARYKDLKAKIDTEESNIGELKSRIEALKTNSFLGLCDPDAFLIKPSLDKQMKQCYPFKAVANFPYYLRFVGYGKPGTKTSEHKVKETFDNCLKICSGKIKADAKFNGMGYDWKNKVCVCYDTMKGFYQTDNNVLYSFTK